MENIFSLYGSLMTDGWILKLFNTNIMKIDKVNVATEETIYSVFRKLIGDTRPVGETNEDNKRYENLKVMCCVVEQLLCDIDDIACDYKDRQEYSIKRAGELADKWCRMHLAE